MADKVMVAEVVVLTEDGRFSDSKYGGDARHNRW